MRFVNKPGIHNESKLSSNSHKPGMLNIQKLSTEEINEIFAKAPKYSPEFSEEEISRYIKDLVSYISKLVIKTKVPNEEIEQYFGHLSVADILSIKKLFYMNPCMNLAFLTLTAIKESKIENPMLVIDELSHPDNSDFALLHFGVQFYHSGKHYYIDYKDLNNVIFGSGFFRSDYKEKGIEVKYSHRLRADSISYETSFHSLRRAGNIEFNNFSERHFTNVVEKYKKDNTDEQYLSFLEKTRAVDTPIFVEINRLNKPEEKI